MEIDRSIRRSPTCCCSNYCDKRAFDRNLNKRTRSEAGPDPLWILPHQTVDQYIAPLSSFGQLFLPSMLRMVGDDAVGEDIDAESSATPFDPINVSTHKE